jgi:hypothetical protein
LVAAERGGCSSEERVTMHDLEEALMQDLAANAGLAPGMIPIMHNIDMGPAAGI